MRTYILPQQDATIYQRYPTKNAGLDEILEVGKLVKPDDLDAKYNSGSVRCLLDFDISTSSPYPSYARYYLKLYLAKATDVNRYQKIQVYPVTRRWVEGSGYFYQDYKTVNEKNTLDQRGYFQNYKNVADGTSWASASISQGWTIAGGDYSTSISASTTLSQFPLEDVTIDVTNLIAPVVAGTNTVPWNGLILKFPSADEADATNTGNIKLFSLNTHTVFAPKLEIVYADQSFTTGNLKAIPNSNVSIISRNLKQAYTKGEVDKIYLVVRDPYPDKRFDSTQRYRNMYYLPSESYFRIKDQVSGVILQDFDPYSAISCDVSGSYFILDTTGMEVNRYYTIDLKVKKNNLVFFPEFNYTFMIDNNE